MEFKLGKAQIIFDKSFVFYNKYYRDLTRIADEIENDFLDEVGKLNSIEDIINKAPVIASEKMDVAISYCVDALIENEIYDYDVDVFREECDDDILLEKSNEYLQLKHIYEQICSSEDLRNEQAAYQRACRSRWVGGGFGIKGAITGAMTAGAMNLVTGCHAAFYSSARL